MVLGLLGKMLFHVLMISILWKHWSLGAKRTCEIVSRRGQISKILEYSDEEYNCIKCPRRNNNDRGRNRNNEKNTRKTLVHKSIQHDKEEICGLKCNGLLCPYNLCISLKSKKLNLLGNDVDPCKTRERGPHFPEDDDDDHAERTTHVPLVVGFAVGGVMLAVVIVGVILGRTNKPDSSSESVATTPVSMSYSEWISNYSYGGRGSKVGNMRVQESGSQNDDEEDAQILPVYSIVYGDNEATTVDDEYKQYYEEPTVIEIDDLSPYDESYPINYQCSDDREMSVSSPVYDGRDTVTVEYTSDMNYYDPYGNLSNDVAADNLRTNSLTSSANFRDENDGTQNHDVTSNDAVYVNTRNSWSSDGSEKEETCFFHDSSNENAVASADETNLSQEQNLLGVNLANLKHVFVDVHRSMGEVRRSQLLLANNSQSSDMLNYLDGVTEHSLNDEINVANDCDKSISIELKQSENTSRRFSI